MDSKDLIRFCRVIEARRERRSAASNTDLVSAAAAATTPSVCPEAIQEHHLQRQHAAEETAERQALQHLLPLVATQVQYAYKRYRYSMP